MDDQQFVKNLKGRSSNYIQENIVYRMQHKKTVQFWPIGMLKNNELTQV
jgi:hypothetical protein